MRHRIHIDAPYAAGEQLTVSGEEFHHAARVVRVREGEEIELFDGRGHGAKGRVVRIDRDTLAIAIDALLPSDRESPLRLELAMSIIQLEKFELVLQKATELGVHAITPVVTDRIELRAERYRGKAERWEKIVFEAVKQSGRTAVPKLNAPAEFDEVIARDGVRILFDADREPRQLVPTDAATLLIGPEGGWSERELELAVSRGATFQRLGPRRLRAETAAIVGVSLISARFGDLT